MAFRRKAQDEAEAHFSYDLVNHYGPKWLAGASTNRRAREPVVRQALDLRPRRTEYKNLPAIPRCLPQ